MSDAEIREPADLGTLHDLALVAIGLDWQVGVAALELVDHDGTGVFVLVHGLTHFELSREFEWGQSAYVNEASVRRLPTGAVRLSFEMQSGDAIAVTGIRLERSGSRSDEPDPSALPLG